jgi:hypothetical protein
MEAQRLAHYNIAANSAASASPLACASKMFLGA